MGPLIFAPGITPHSSGVGSTPTNELLFQWSNPTDELLFQWSTPTNELHFQWCGLCLGHGGHSRWSPWSDPSAQSPSEPLCVAAEPQSGPLKVPVVSSQSVDANSEAIPHLRQAGGKPPLPQGLPKIPQSHSRVKMVLAEQGRVRLQRMTLAHCTNLFWEAKVEGTLLHVLLGFG